MWLMGRNTLRTPNFTRREVMAMTGPGYGFGSGWNRTYESADAKIAEKGNLSVVVDSGVVSVYDAEADVEVHVSSAQGMTPGDAQSVIDLACGN